MAKCHRRLCIEYVLALPVCECLRVVDVDNPLLLTIALVKDTKSIM